MTELDHHTRSSLALAKKIGELIHQEANGLPFKVGFSIGIAALEFTVANTLVQLDPHREALREHVKKFADRVHEKAANFSVRFGDNV